MTLRQQQQGDLPSNLTQKAKQGVEQGFCHQPSPSTREIDVVEVDVKSDIPIAAAFLLAVAQLGKEMSATRSTSSPAQTLQHTFPHSL